MEHRAETRPVLMVWLPEGSTQDPEMVRDSIVESLQMGVVVLGPGMIHRVEALPDLGGVEVFGGIMMPRRKHQDLRDTYTLQETLPPTQPDPPVLREHSIVAAEKEAVLARMQQYRDVHKLGCWDAVAEKVGRKDVDAGLLRDMLLRRASPELEVWRAIGKALEEISV